jgi:hypothetical protein
MIQLVVHSSLIFVLFVSSWFKWFHIRFDGMRRSTMTVSFQTPSSLP